MKKLKLATLYSQRDPRWANTLLGTNTDKQYSIGNYGCMITSVCAYLNALGINETPLTLNNRLKDQTIGGFINGGLFVFDSLRKIWPDIAMDYVSSKWPKNAPDSAIDKMKQLIDQGHPMITEVDFYPNTVMEDMHWVLIYGYNDTGDFFMFDPWTGSQTMLLSAYGDIKRVMYCYRTYTKPLPFDGVEEVICYPKSIGASYRDNSDKWIATAQYLEIGGDPNTTPFETIKSVVAGLKSRLTDLQNQLGTAQGEITNREEQVSRLKQQVLDEQKLREDLQNKLKQALSGLPGVSGVYEARIKELQGQIDAMGKEKGELAQKLKACELKLTGTSVGFSFSIWFKFFANIATKINEVINKLKRKG
jgi:hypothetical protein